MALHEGVDGGIGADVRRIDGAGIERLHGSRAGIEYLGAELGGAKVLLDEALVDPHKRRSVGDVA